MGTGALDPDPIFLGHFAPDPGVLIDFAMHTRCPNCLVRFRFTAPRTVSNTVTLRCSVCQFSWVYSGIGHLTTGPLNEQKGKDIYALKQWKENVGHKEKPKRQAFQKKIPELLELIDVVYTQKHPPLPEKTALGGDSDALEGYNPSRAARAAAFVSRQVVTQRLMMLRAFLLLCVASFAVPFWHEQITDEFPSLRLYASYATQVSRSTIIDVADVQISPTIEPLTADISVQLTNTSSLMQQAPHVIVFVYDAENVLIQQYSVAPSFDSILPRESLQYEMMVTDLHANADEILVSWHLPWELWASP